RVAALPADGLAVFGGVPVADGNAAGAVSRASLVGLGDMTGSSSLRGADPSHSARAVQECLRQYTPGRIALHGAGDRVAPGTSGPRMRKSSSSECAPPA